MSAWLPDQPAWSRRTSTGRHGLPRLAPHSAPAVYEAGRCPAATLPALGPVQVPGQCLGPATCSGDSEVTSLTAPFCRDKVRMPEADPVLPALLPGMELPATGLLTPTTATFYGFALPTAHHSGRADTFHDFNISGLKMTAQSSPVGIGPLNAYAQEFSLAGNKCFMCLISRFRCGELRRAEVLTVQADQCCVMGVFMCIYARYDLSHGLFPALPIWLQLKGVDQAGRQDANEFIGHAQAPIRSYLLDRHPLGVLAEQADQIQDKPHQESSVSHRVLPGKTPNTSINVPQT